MWCQPEVLHLNLKLSDRCEIWQDIIMIMATLLPTILANINDIQTFNPWRAGSRLFWGNKVRIVAAEKINA